MKRCLSMMVLAACSALAQDLPDGPGKPAVEKICSGCHGLATVTGLRRTPQQWESTVDEMAARGAQGSDQEFDAVVAYLSRYFGKVNINTATSKQLQEIVELSPAEADAILKYREKNGEFKDLADLEKVPGIDAGKLRERKDRITFR